MRRITQAFQAGNAFVGFVTGGDPTLAATEQFIVEMIHAGADVIEIGIPFSDPIAEGPTIQAANLRALGAGTTIDAIFAMTSNLRRVHLTSDVQCVCQDKLASTPFILLTYLNPVFHYGYERFFAHAHAAGIDGIIIPDLPYEEQAEVQSIARHYAIDVITLIAPTSAARVATLAAQATGFVYVVSSMGVTGMRSAITTDLAALVTQVKARTDTPVAVGFGIHTPAQAAAIAAVADGVIVGSAIVKLIEQYGLDAGGHIYDYVQSMKQAMLTSTPQRDVLPL